MVAIAGRRITHRTGISAADAVARRNLPIGSVVAKNSIAVERPAKGMVSQ